MKTAEYWINKLELTPHPEGGYYREIYRSKGKIPAEALPSLYSGNREYMSAIFFLLRSKDVSLFHRLESDEIWCFHAGTTALLHTISKKNGHRKIELGAPESGKPFCRVVPAHTWIAAEVTAPKSFSLVSCFVSPAFCFDDFEMADRQTLIRHFPDHEKTIRRFTSKPESEAPPDAK